MSKLNVLLVVGEQDRGLLAEFLIRRDCQLQVVGDLQQALQTYHQRAHSTDPHDIIIADVSAPSDGHSLAQALRHQYNSSVCIAWLIDFQDNTADRQEARSALQIDHVFTKPVDLAEFTRYIELKQHALASGLSLRASEGSEHSSDSEYEVDATPFFGNSSGVFRSGSGRHPIRRSSGDDPFDDGHQSSGYQRRSSGVYEHNDRGLNMHTSQRIRRSVTGSFRTDSSGTYQASKEPEPEEHKQVRCAHCQHVFTVVRRKEGYVMPCISCGGLNRIMP